MLRRIKFYNDLLMEAGPQGNVQSELLFCKDKNTFNFEKGWAFPRRIYFNSDNCVMPPLISELHLSLSSMRFLISLKSLWLLDRLQFVLNKFMRCVFQRLWIEDDDHTDPIAYSRPQNQVHIKETCLPHKGLAVSVQVAIDLPRKINHVPFCQVHSFE